KVVVSLVPDLSYGLIERVDAKDSAGHSAPRPKLIQNWAEIAPFGLAGSIVGQPAIDLSAPSLLPFFGRDVVRMNLVGESSRQLRREPPSASLEFVSEGPQRLCLQSDLSSVRARHAQQLTHAGNAHNLVV